MQLDHTKVVKKESFNFILNGAPWTTREKLYRAQDGGLLVPLKTISEKLGFKVGWSPADKAVEVKTPFETVVIRSVQGHLVAMQEHLKAYGELTHETAGVLKAGKIYVPVTFFSEVLGGVVHVGIGASGGYIVTMDALKPSPALPGIKGEIVEIECMQKGARIRVKGEPYGAFQLEDMLLNIDSSTPIMDPMAGNALKVQDLCCGHRILAHYSQDIGKGIPAIGKASSIEVLKDCDVLEGKIYELIQGPNTVMMRVIGTDDYSLSVGKDAVLMGRKKETLSKDHLRLGMSVKVYRSEISTFSIPPVSKVFHVQLIKSVTPVPNLGDR